MYVEAQLLIASTQRYRVSGSYPERPSDDLNLVSCDICRLEHLLCVCVRNFLDKSIGIQLSGKSSAKDLMCVGGSYSATLLLNERRIACSSR